MLRGSSLNPAEKAELMSGLGGEEGFKTELEMEAFSIREPEMTCIS